MFTLYSMRRSGNCYKVRLALAQLGIAHELVEMDILQGETRTPEFIAKKLRRWLKTLEVEPVYIEPGSPWENGYVESFNGKMRDQFLNGELFYTLKEAQILTERWRIHYNTVRPHRSLGGQPPVPETFRLAS